MAQLQPLQVCTCYHPLRSVKMGRGITPGHPRLLRNTCVSVRSKMARNHQKLSQEQLLPLSASETSARAAPANIYSSGCPCQVHAPSALRKHCGQELGQVGPRGRCRAIRAGPLLLNCQCTCCCCSSWSLNSQRTVGIRQKRKRGLEWGA